MGQLTRNQPRLANLEMMEWQHHYGTGPISQDQAAHTYGANTSIKDQIFEVLNTQYGIMPKKGSSTYAKPYPAVYDQMEPPPRFKIPDFSKFSGNDSTTTIVHVSQYLA